MTLLTVSKLSKKYPNTHVLDNISFNVKQGEFISIFGPNGCGKSTLLNIISGLDRRYTGSVSFTDKGIKKAYIFQNADESVLPWKSITENVRLDNKTLKTRRIKEVLSELKLWKFRDAYPYQLSGGMKQLLAIARAFVHGCDVLFLDEPFSSLDYHMASAARERLLNLWQKERPTVLFVSHDIDEAILLSDRVLVFSNRPSRIKQEVEIKLPRNRDASILSSKQFLEYKKIIMDCVKNEI